MPVCLRTLVVLPDSYLKEIHDSHKGATLHFVTKAKWIGYSLLEQLNSRTNQFKKKKNPSVNFNWPECKTVALNLPNAMTF